MYSISWVNAQETRGMRTIVPVYVFTKGKNIQNGRDFGVSTSSHNAVGLNYAEINMHNKYPFRNYDVMLNYVKMQVTGGSLPSPGGAGGAHFHFVQSRMELQFNSYLLHFGTLKRNNKFSLGIYTNLILYSKSEGSYIYNNKIAWDSTINYYKFYYATEDLSHSQQIFNFGFAEKGMLLLNAGDKNALYLKQAFKYGFLSETRIYRLVRSVQLDLGLLYFPNWCKTKGKK